MGEGSRRSSLTKETTPGRELLTTVAGRSACAAFANRRCKRPVAGAQGGFARGASDRDGLLANRVVGRRDAIRVGRLFPAAVLYSLGRERRPVSVAARSRLRGRPDARGLAPTAPAARSAAR